MPVGNGGARHAHAGPVGRRAGVEPESFELPSCLPTRLYWLIFGSARGRTNAEGMRVTLEKMKAVVESG